LAGFLVFLLRPKNLLRNPAAPCLNPPEPRAPPVPPNMEPLAVAHVALPSRLPGDVADSAPAAPRPTLAELFMAEESGLLRFALGLVGRRSVAEELVQETFLRLQPLWAEVENPRAWLYRSLRNLALNHLRDRRPEAELADADTAPAADLPLPADQLGHAEAVGLVRLLLAELPPADRRLIELKYREDLRYDEIGRRTGLTAGNVGYRLHHLLKGLADRLRRAGVEDSRG
jgi:RNA polymerase sigma factor (sigma-70 family)